MSNTINIAAALHAMENLGAKSFAPKLNTKGELPKGQTGGAVDFEFSDGEVILKFRPTEHSDTGYVTKSGKEIAMRRTLVLDSLTGHKLEIIESQDSEKAREAKIAKACLRKARDIQKLDERLSNRKLSAKEADRIAKRRDGLVGELIKLGGGKDRLGYWYDQANAAEIAILEKRTAELKAAQARQLAALQSK